MWNLTNHFNQVHYSILFAVFHYLSFLTSFNNSLAYFSHPSSQGIRDWTTVLTYSRLYLSWSVFIYFCLFVLDNLFLVPMLALSCVCSPDRHGTSGPSCLSISTDWEHGLCYQVWLMTFLLKRTNQFHYQMAVSLAYLIYYASCSPQV